MNHTFNIMTITILSQFFLNAPRTISAFAAVKRLLDLDIKFLAICLALDGLVAMPNPETKSTPKTLNTIAIQIMLKLSRCSRINS